MKSDKEILALLDAAIKECASDLENTSDPKYGEKVEAFVKLYEARRDEKNRRPKLALEALGIGAPLGVYLLCFFRGLKYEFKEDGIFTSVVLRNLISKFKVN